MPDEDAIEIIQGTKAVICSKSREVKTLSRLNIHSADAKIENKQEG